MRKWAKENTTKPVLQAENRCEQGGCETTPTRTEHQATSSPHQTESRLSPEEDLETANNGESTWRTQPSDAPFADPFRKHYLLHPGQGQQEEEKEARECEDHVITAHPREEQENEPTRGQENADTKRKYIRKKYPPRTRETRGSGKITQAEPASTEAPPDPMDLSEEGPPTIQAPPAAPAIFSVYKKQPRRGKAVQTGPRTRPEHHAAGGISSLWDNNLQDHQPRHNGHTHLGQQGGPRLEGALQGQTPIHGGNLRRMGQVHDRQSTGLSGVRMRNESIWGEM